MTSLLYRHFMMTHDLFTTILGPIWCLPPCSHLEQRICPGATIGTIPLYTLTNFYCQYIGHKSTRTLGAVYTYFQGLTGINTRHYGDQSIGMQISWYVDHGMNRNLKPKANSYVRRNKATLYNTQYAILALQVSALFMQYRYLLFVPFLVSLFFIWSSILFITLQCRIYLTRWCRSFEHCL